MPNKVNKGGQPTKMTDNTIRLLKDAFSWGCTDSEACCFAEISTSTLYKYCSENPEFSELKNKLKDMPTMKARRIIVASLDDSDLNTANRVIDRVTTQKVESKNLNVELTHEEWLDTLD